MQAMLAGTQARGTTTSTVDVYAHASYFKPHNLIKIKRQYRKRALFGKVRVQRTFSSARLIRRDAACTIRIY